jgi:hypothetical protein
VRTKYNFTFSDTDLGQGYLMSEGDHSLDVPSLSKTGNLYARVMVSSSGENLIFNFDGISKVINTHGSQNNFHWVNLGKYQNYTPVNIVSSGKLNILNTFAILSDTQKAHFEQAVSQSLANSDNIIEVFQHLRPGKYNKQLISESPIKYAYLRIGPSEEDRYINFSVAAKSVSIQVLSSPVASWINLGKMSVENKSINILNDSNLTDISLLLSDQGLKKYTSTSVPSTQISQTKYRLTVDEPSHLVFSETFDPNWRLQPGNIAPFPAYDILNGFNITTPGEYQLEFVPQRMVNVLFPISVSVFFLLIFLSFTVKK